MDIATKVEELNEKYKINNSNGLNINSSINYTLVYGNIPILLSAPHAVKQLRNGKEKAEDANTGGITEYLCNTCKCYGIIRNYNKLDYPNNDNSGLGLEYKKKCLILLRKII